jgi:uncharacterized protein YwgA
MDGRLVVLQRFAEALGESVSIQNFDERKRFQKVVYLGQVAGVDLGYRYGWYIKGPYSTELTRDYYALSQALEADEKIPESQHLVSSAQDALRRLTPVLTPPSDAKLNRSDWLELLASWHYLRTVSKFDERRAQETIQSEKANLAPYIDQARRELRKHSLLQ